MYDYIWEGITQNMQLTPHGHLIPVTLRYAKQVTFSFACGWLPYYSTLILRKAMGMTRNNKFYIPQTSLTMCTRITYCSFITYVTF
jgi:hypothetical protein